MTALAFALIFGGVLLAWAGITGTQLVPALAAVLSGNKPAPAAK